MKDALMTKWLVPPLLLLLVVSSMTEAEQPKKFVPDATVVLSDGTNLELTAFAFYSEQYSPSGLFFESSRRIPLDLILRQGDYWKTVALPQIQEVSFTPDPKNADWLVTEVTLASGDKITGESPKKPSDTWMKGNRFEFHGKSRALDVEGDFNIDITDVKHIARDSSKPDTYVLTDTKGKSISVRNLRFELFWSAPTKMDEYSYEHGSLTVKVENTEVSLKLKDIAQLLFPETTGDKIKIKLKNGDEAIVDVTARIDRVFGKTQSDQTWFVDVSKHNKYVLRSVQFR